MGGLLLQRPVNYWAHCALACFPALPTSQPRRFKVLFCTRPVVLVVSRRVGVNGVAGGCLCCGRCTMACLASVAQCVAVCVARCTPACSLFYWYLSWCVAFALLSRLDCRTATAVRLSVPLNRALPRTSCVGCVVVIGRVSVRVVGVRAFSQVGTQCNTITTLTQTEHHRTQTQ